MSKKENFLQQQLGMVYAKVARQPRLALPFLKKGLRLSPDLLGSIEARSIIKSYEKKEK